VYFAVKIFFRLIDLLEVGIFEFETTVYPEDQFHWQWNENHNLEGYFKGNDEHKFTWQPHGSQFIIIEDVPKNRLAIRIKKPPLIDRETVLTSLKFDASWVEILPEASPTLKNRKKTVACRHAVAGLTKN
jgi:hypothetical protein